MGIMCLKQNTSRNSDPIVVLPKKYFHKMVERNKLGSERNKLGGERNKTHRERNKPATERNIVSI